jgi:hypothetical protein
MRRILATALLSAALLALGVGTAQAQPAAHAQPAAPAANTWGVSYQTAQAGGTYTIKMDFFQVTYTFDGQIANSGSGCYHIHYVVQDDFNLYPGSTAAQCGPGTLPVQFSGYLFTGLGGVSVELCSGQPDENTNCGPYEEY